jgi:hypothetical protein
MPALFTVWGYCKLLRLRGAGNSAGRESVAYPGKPRHVPDSRLGESYRDTGGAEALFVGSSPRRNSSRDTSEISNWFIAAHFGLLLWIGFPVVLLVGSILWENVPVKVAAIHAGDWLVKLLVIPIILSVWH